MSYDLKPCPFCGKEAFVAIDENGRFSVRCIGCGARLVPKIYCGITTSQDKFRETDLENAIESWNRRSND